MYVNERIIMTTNRTQEPCQCTTIRANQNKTTWRQYESRSEASWFLASFMLMKQLLEHTKPFLFNLINWVVMWVNWTIGVIIRCNCYDLSEDDMVAGIASTENNDCYYHFLRWAGKP